MMVFPDAIESSPNILDIPISLCYIIVTPSKEITMSPFKVNRTTKYFCYACEEVCTDASPDGPEYRDIIICSECGHSGHGFTCLPEWNAERFFLLYGTVDSSLYHWKAENENSLMALEDICRQTEEMHELSCVVPNEDVRDQLYEACKNLYEKTDEALTDLKERKPVDEMNLILCFAEVKKVYDNNPTIHWEEPVYLPEEKEEKECEACDGHGVLLITPENSGDLQIQRCDVCNLYKDDNEATMEVFNGYILRS